MRPIRLLLPLIALVTAGAGQAADQAAPRARDLGIPFEGAPGALNAITDVAGVEVGHTTLISGSGKLEVGKGPVRTGVTAILPRGKASTTPVFGGWFTLNAAGEMTGTTWLEERGVIDGPILITNTHSVGVARDAAVRWLVDSGWAYPWHAPIAAETFDGGLNDVNGFHVKTEHVLAAIKGASTGKVQEGSVGGGTGMVCSMFKGGIGTASRKLPPEQGGYTVGVLVQCNYGKRELLRVAGAPVGEILKDSYLPCTEAPFTDPYQRYGQCDAAKKPVRADALPASAAGVTDPVNGDGSIIIIVATDAPLLPHQLKRLAKRPALGLGRLGAIADNGSGDIFLAFSTGNPQIDSGSPMGPQSASVQLQSNEHLSPIFEAAVQATEEAVVNAMVASPTMVGANGMRVYGIPHDRLAAIVKQFRGGKSARQR